MSDDSLNPKEEITVNQYIDDLRHNQHTIPPESLDHEMAGFVRLLVVAEDGKPSLEEAARARIWQKAIATTIDQHTQRTGIRIVLPPRQQLTLRFVAALILAVALTLMIFGPRPVSAAEIVSRATQTANNPASAGITSYRAVISFTSNGFNIQNNTILPGLVFQSQMFEWYRAPQLRRDEVFVLREMDSRSLIIPMPTVMASSLKPASLNAIRTSFAQPRLARLYGADAVQQWDYDVERHVITLEDMTPHEGQTNPFGGSNLSSMLLNAAQNYDNVQLLGSSTVAGRAVYLIEVTTKPSDALLPGQKTVYKIDQQNFLTLGETTTDGKGNMLSSTEFLDIQINPILDDSLFTLTTPPGTVVIDLHTLPSLSPSELAQRWHDVAAQNPFPVYAPSVVPNGAIAGRPATNVYSKDMIEQHYRIKDDPWAIQFSEANFDFSPRNIGTPIEVGPYQGYYDDQHGVLELSLHIVQNTNVDQPGTYVVFRCQPQSATKDDLIRMAESLQHIVIPTSIF